MHTLRRYLHYKNPKAIYRILIDNANDVDSLEKVVVYQSEASGDIWVRKHSEFFGKVPGTETLRFTPIEDGDVR